MSCGYGTGPLDPTSFPTSTSVPSTGEVDRPFLLLNLAGGGSLATDTNEADDILFSVCDHISIIK